MRSYDIFRYYIIVSSSNFHNTLKLGDVISVQDYHIKSCCLNWVCIRDLDINDNGEEIIYGIEYNSDLTIIQIQLYHYNLIIYITIYSS